MAVQFLTDRSFNFPVDPGFALLATRVYTNPLRQGVVGFREQVDPPPLVGGVSFARQRLVQIFSGFFPADLSVGLGGVQKESEWVDVGPPTPTPRGSLSESLSMTCAPGNDEILSAVSKKVGIYTVSFCVVENRIWHLWKVQPPQI